MKDQILKIAGVKSEKEFYKKYPTEESFMKAHKKEFKKAAMGKSMVNTQLHQLTDFGNPPKYYNGGPLNANMIKSYQSSTMPSMSAIGNRLSDPAFQQQAIKQVQSAQPKGGFDAMGAATAAVGALPGIIAGVEAIDSQKKAKKKAEQATQLSGLALQAQQTTEKAKRKYVRPEDALIQPGQLGDPYGTGTNYLAENGTRIGGNPTEIQNMYNPGDMYTDLGFEPMGKTLKQYKYGGEMPKAEFGEYFQSSGQAQIGSAAGTAIGSLVGGPLGGAIGGLIGTAAGNLLGGAKQARELQKEKDRAEMNTQQAAFAQAQQNQFGAYMEQGGKVDVGDEYEWVSHTWQPQKIVKFGEYNVKDLLKPPTDADMLRSGGHLKEYTPPSAEAMFTGRPPMPRAEDGVQMAMGGELQVGDGGYLETVSYNPNLPGGEIGMFRGASHDNGGIQTKYGDNEVEVEGGEPAVKLKDGGSEDNLVVFGNMKINKNIADLIGDPKAKGMKFKTYVADIAKNDAKQLKKINKGLELIENSNENNAFDHLSLNTGALMIKGAQDWQKINADKIKEAGIVQDAIHQTAKELGVKNDKLAEGKLEQETDPSMVAQDGATLKSFLKTPFAERKKLAKQLGYTDYTGKDLAQQKKLYDLFKKKSGDSKVYNPPTPVNLVDNTGPNYNWMVNSTPFPRPLPQTADASEEELRPPSIEDMPGDFSPKKSRKLLNTLKKTGKFLGEYGPGILSNIQPFLRPTNADEPLPPDQIYPEFYALATNQLQPVQAQTYQPMLDSPVDISFNDQLAAVDAQSRAAIRAAGSNPAAQAMIMSQTLQAKNQLLGERDRINTANRIQVYDKNRAALNDAQLRNLQILDQQYVRQAQAASNTRDQTLSALSSIAAKTAQQRAVNRKLGIMENLYNFRFDSKGRAINVNPLQFFNTSGDPFARGTRTSGGLAPDTAFTYDELGQIIGTRKINKSSGANPSLNELNTFMDTQKNGGKTKARNSSIVKALKNL